VQAEKVVGELQGLAVHPEDIQRLFKETPAGLAPADGVVVDVNNPALVQAATLLQSPAARQGLAMMGVRTPEQLGRFLAGKSISAKRLSGDMSLKGLLTDIGKGAIDPIVGKLAARIHALLPQDIPVFTGLAKARPSAGNGWAALYDRALGTVHLRSASPEVAQIKLRGDAELQKAVVHEAVHAVTAHQITLGKGGKLVGAAKEGYEGLTKLFDHLTSLRGNHPELDAALHGTDALEHVEELVTYGMTHPPLRDALRNIQYGQKRTAYSAFMSGLRKLLGLKRDEATAFDQLVSSFESFGGTTQAVRTDFAGVPLEFRTGQKYNTDKHVTAVSDLAKAQAALDRHNAQAEVAGPQPNDKFASVPDPVDAAMFRDIERRAIADNGAHPIDQAKLTTVLTTLQKVSPAMANALESTGIKLLRSENPVMVWAGRLITESTTGAGGRGRTASMAKFQLDNKYRENLYGAEQEFANWAKEQGLRWDQRMLGNDHYLTYQSEIAAGIRQRASGASLEAAHSSPSIQRAIEAIEEHATLAATHQRTARTPGYEALPASSVGYYPQRFSASKLVSTTPSQLRALESEFQKQGEAMGWDTAFALRFAKEYIQHARSKAFGEVEVPANMRDPAFNQRAYEMLRSMKLSNEEILARMTQMNNSAAGHTKSRIDWDLGATVTDPVTGESHGLADFFDTDIIELFGAYNRRVSGDVALAQVGVPGQRGLQMMRQSATYGENAATMEELRAFDQVAAEMYGRPWGEGGNNKNLANLRMLTQMSMLGTNGFQQLMEGTNIMVHLGTESFLKSVPGIRKLFAETSKLDKAGIVENIELIGGVQDAASRFVFYHDTPGDSVTMRAEDYNAADRLIRAGAKAFPTINLSHQVKRWQMDNAIQQTVAKVTRMLRNGDNIDGLVADMGFTPELVAKMRAEVHNIAKWDADDHLVEFDLTKAGDLAAAREFSDAVVRGTHQMIQGNFIGETGKYIHGDLMKILTQFRTFSILSAEKQWARVATNVGAATAFGFLAMQAAAALPLHYARVQLQAAGLPEGEREQFLAARFSVAALTQATLNYTSLSGVSGEAVNVLSGMIALGVDDPDIFGPNQGARGMDALGVIPSLSFVQGVGKNAGRLGQSLFDGDDGSSVEASARMLRTMTNLPFITPMLNAMHED
jgi:hypothetical protein